MKLKKFIINLESYSDYILSSIFISHFLAQTFLYYSGIGYTINPVRQWLLLLIDSAYALLVIILVGNKILNRKYSKLQSCLCVPVLAVIAIILFRAVIIFSPEREILRQSVFFLIFGVPAALCGLEAAARLNWRSMLKIIELAGLATLPLAVLYIGMCMVNSTSFKYTYMGGINYMALGYGFMPIFFAALINYALYAPHFGAPENLNSLKDRLARLRPGSVIIYFTAICISNTRGAIVAGLVFILALLLWLSLKKCPCRRVIILSAILFVIFIAVQFYYQKTGYNRFAVISLSIRLGDIATTTSESPVVKRNIRLIIEHDSIDHLIVDGIHIKAAIRDRITFYELAWREALKAPLTGLSPLGFTSKYGTYPHNAVLEILADLGFVMGGTVLLGCGALAFNLLKLLCKNGGDIGSWVIFLIGIFLPTMLSGSVWNSKAIFFCLFFSIGLGLVKLSPAERPKIGGERPK